MMSTLLVMAGVASHRRHTPDRRHNWTSATTQNTHSGLRTQGRSSSERVECISCCRYLAALHADYLPDGAAGLTSSAAFCRASTDTESSW